MDSVLRKIPVNGFRICVDEKRADIKGRAYSPLTTECIEFSGFNELLLKMDQLFDQVGYPEAFQEKRTFASEKSGSHSFQGIPEAKSDEKNIKEQQGREATYDVVVTARRNASWQGGVYDEADQEICTFQGEIELLAQIMQDRV